MTTFGLTSCYDDKGNYDYVDIDDIKVEFPGNMGTESDIRFVERQGNTLNITPDVECMDKSHLTYLWERYTSGVETEVLKKDKDVSLPLTAGDDANLQWKVGTYKLRFTVKDTVTQQTCQKLVNVTVKSITPIGVQVLTTTDGESDISTIEDNDFIEGLEQPSVTYNYFSQQNDGIKLDGEGRNINYFHSSDGSALIALTDHDGCSIDMSTFQPNIAYDDLFSEEPENIKRMVNTAGMYLVYADNNIYNLDVTYGLVLDDEPAFEPTFGSEEEMEYAPEPSYVSSESGTMAGGLIYGNIAYNAEKNKFLLYDWYHDQMPGIPFPMQDMSEDSYAPVFNPSEMNAGDLVGMDYGIYTNYLFSQNQWALFKNETDNGANLTLYRFNDEGYNDEKATYDKKQVIATDNSNTELANVNCFQMSTLIDGIGFFSTPNGVYSLNANETSNGLTELFTPSNGNEQVTMIRLLKYQMNDETTRNVNPTFFSRLSKSLYIATWDGIQGRIYRIGLTEEGQLDSAVEMNEWDGFGEIKDMCFRLQ